MADLRAQRAMVDTAQQGIARDWAPRVVSMRERMQDLARAGRWASGPHDLLSVVGLNRWELAHSAALGWLCNPNASHGLGSAFLDGLVARTGKAVDVTGPIVCRTEVARADSRADVVVEGPGWVLVIEVKVDAGEQPRQAQRLYEDWFEDSDARFIFLTRHDLPPATACLASRDHWTVVSWRTVRGLLTSLAASGQPSAHGRPALTEYLRTLESTF